ncbi:unnamed protein product [Thelazia callipaeda]|uniref:Uncharacterized protein n=1 Tax=Thelazia callipaeda TaxID=103827 RepID=A0A0N5CJE0_THECL|nr:unnamed protein product [Thelazia callipaeda]
MSLELGSLLFVSCLISTAIIFRSHNYMGDYGQCPATIRANPRPLLRGRGPILGEGSRPTPHDSRRTSAFSFSGEGYRLPPFQKKGYEIPRLSTFYGCTDYIFLKLLRIKIEEAGKEILEQLASGRLICQIARNHSLAFSEFYTMQLKD